MRSTCLRSDTGILRSRGSLTQRRGLQRRNMRKLSFSIVCALFICCVVPAHATDLRDVITDVTITSWNEKDGLPSATIWALTQDRDGYLWIGSRLGLFRFDGVRFTPWASLSSEPLPAQSIRSLLATRSGDLWIGFSADGVIARVADGHVTAYRARDSLGRGAVLALAEDADGALWAGGDAGLFAFDGTRWNGTVGESGVPDGPIFALSSDHAGTLHVASTSGVFSRPRRGDTFERVDAFTDTFGAFAEGADGGLWLTDPRVGFRTLASPLTTPDQVKRQGRGIRMLVDRKGNLWTGTGGQGLWRARHASSLSAVERASSLTGLLGDGVYALLEDRDGNIWAGTTEGLNRITPRTIEQVIDIGLVRAVDIDSGGRIWIRTVDRVLSYDASLDGTRTETSVPTDTRMLAADGTGVWLASKTGVVHIDRSGQRMPLRWSIDVATGVDSAVPDHHGGLWVIVDGQRVMHWTGRAIDRIALPVDVQSSRVTALFADSHGRGWVGFANGRVGVVDGDGAMSVVRALPESPHVVRAMAEDASGRIWCGGDGILASIDRERVAILPSSPRFPVEAIGALVADERDGIWIGASIGVVHLGVHEFERAAADASIGPYYSLYTRTDGVAGTPVIVPFNRGAVRAPDGRLWFVTTRGITVIDPHVLEARRSPSPVKFDGAFADDRRLPQEAPLVLAAGTRRLEIDYTVVNLTTPLKARFRYRLDPFDRDWVTAGARRQAFYTNLKPGSYVFRVASEAVDGTDQSEASWDLTLEPMFYQTSTFAGLVVASIGMLVFGGWRLRERHLRSQFSLLIAERARLGREIHDTLLQGLVAIALQFDSLAHELSAMPPLQARFSRLRDRVEEYIREARRSIWDLHTQPPHRNLVESLKRAGEFATDGREIAFTFQLQGTPFECPATVEEQVVRIAQEASLNSVRHAAPTQLWIDLKYDDTAVTITVADDGSGFDAQFAKGGGHVGIRSMQERARSVGGALTLTTSPGRGTAVTAVLPVAS